MTSQPSPNPETQSPVEPDEVHTGVLFVTGSLLVVGVVLIMLFLQAWFYNWRGSVAQQREIPSNSPETALGRAILEDRAKINTYHWINREAGTRAIPIHRAMELVAEEMAARQNASAAKLKK
jgi:hypothetical protein